MTINSFDEAFNLVRRETACLSRDRIVADLNIILDKIKFSPEIHDAFLGHDVKRTKEVIEFVFAGDLSSEMFHLLLSMADRRLLSFFVGQTGKDFVAKCRDSLFAAREITFVSAVPLSQEFQAKAMEMLSNGLNSQLKIVFEVDPYLVAGFKVSDGEKAYDYSLKSHSLPNIHLFLEGRMGQQQVSR